MTNTLNKDSESTQKSPHIHLTLFVIIAFSLLFHFICMANAHLLVEEAYYWNYSQHLDFSYLDHPPMVALLIKCSTSILGTNEFAVRLPSLLCWMVTAFFSFKLAQLICRGAGIYAIMLFTVLPFFFIQSLVITPDVPLIACWSASLYYLYRALVLKQSSTWYRAGIWLGLGMLSKYTISLLGLATLLYVIIVPNARQWFTRKEPYIGALIATLIFTPVIYWNATHHWASFLFQSKRRFASVSSIDLHHLIALIFVFITPIGVIALWDLMKKNIPPELTLTHNTQCFMQIFTLMPLGFFAFFSLNHEVNLNWIGPLFLAFIPWIAALCKHFPKKRALWFRTALALLFCYVSVFLIASFNTSEQVQQKLFIKAVAWEPLMKQFHDLAQRIETETHQTPIFAPLDNFPIGSELSFYQAKFLAEGTTSKIYPVLGAHPFGIDSLMYRYWSNDKHLDGATLILITKELWRFDLPELQKQVAQTSELKSFWSTGQGQGVKNIPFYYKVVQLKG